MNERGAGDERLRLAELIAMLSLATDLGLGQPMEYLLRTCVLGVRLAATLGHTCSGHPLHRWAVRLANDTT
jgi:hypothetical protein